MFLYVQYGGLRSGRLRTLYQSYTLILLIFRENVNKYPLIRVFFVNIHKKQDSSIPLRLSRPKITDSFRFLSFPPRLLAISPEKRI